MNQYLIQRLEGIRQTLVAQGMAGKGLSSASKGEEREVFVREFLAKVFSATFSLWSR